MNPSQEFWFDHEKLEAYQEALSFIGWLRVVVDTTVRAGEVEEELGRASSSIALNIAQGNGKYLLKERSRFFNIAHGFALQCAAGLDIVVARGKLSIDQVRLGKEQLRDLFAC